jgi:SAM-dependent methyltransferase
MPSTRGDADDQKQLWNGPAARAWVDAQETLDRMFKPFEDLLVDAASAGGARRVIDVGCGTGATTVAVARAVGLSGVCTGIDVSEPMIAAARARASREGVPATFLVADAQSHAFAPRSADAIVSRFGVMFFDDPVRAFANLRHAAVAGARMTLIAWRSPSENAFMTAAERAAAPLLPVLPPRQPGAPGQFAFADAHRVRTILAASRWADISITPIDVTCVLPEAELVGYVTRFGPVGRVLQDVGEPTRTQVVHAVRAAFEPFVHGDEVRYTAACWMIRAVA